MSKIFFLFVHKIFTDRQRSFEAKRMPYNSARTPKVQLVPWDAAT